MRWKASETCSAVSVFRSRLARAEKRRPTALAWIRFDPRRILFFLQASGLGGVIASFGVVLDGIGFLLALIFVLVLKASQIA
jgi:hypothetical protein